jgi:hypothetical protein
MQGDAMKTTITKKELDDTIIVLFKLANWYDDFGNYTRAADIDRLLDGIKEYKNDILNQ